MDASTPVYRSNEGLNFDHIKNHPDNKLWGDKTVTQKAMHLVSKAAWYTLSLVPRMIRAFAETAGMTKLFWPAHTKTHMVNLLNSEEGDFVTVDKHAALAADGHIVHKVPTYGKTWGGEALEVVIMQKKGEELVNQPALLYIPSAKDGNDTAECQFEMACALERFKDCNLFVPNLHGTARSGDPAVMRDNLIATVCHMCENLDVKPADLKIQTKGLTGHVALLAREAIHALYPDVKFELDDLPTSYADTIANMAARCALRFLGRAMDSEALLHGAKNVTLGLIEEGDALGRDPIEHSLAKHVLDAKIAFVEKEGEEADVNAAPYSGVDVRNDSDLSRPLEGPSTWGSYVTTPFTMAYNSVASVLSWIGSWFAPSN